MDVLSHPEFRSLWITEAVSLAGDQLAKVALAIMVFGRTQSALWAALVYAMTFLPALAGGLGLSQLADHFPRRTIVIGCMLIQAVLVAAMAVPGTPLPVLCALVFGVGLAGAPANAAQHAIIREAISDDELYLRSQDLRGVTTNTMMLVGLAGGGVLVTLIGPQLALLLDALTFLLAAGIVRACVRHRPRATASRDGWFDGARLVFGDRRLRNLTWLGWLVGFAAVPAGLAAPLVSELDAGDQAVGWLLAADPLGFVIGAFLLARFVPAAARLRLVPLLATVSLALLVPFALQPTLLTSLLLLTLGGMTGAYLITVNATFLTLVPNELRGGAGGVYRTGLRVSQGIGVAIAGAVAEWLGSAMYTVAIGGATGATLALLVTAGWLRVRGQVTVNG
ncbi:MFS transporter [Haloechinothrix sp. LS1_15]|uniref:MFS transporter n=1 Tax=Haloechinothrix sp. LS1_15 TaxID=2652248 RepID=UPI00294AC626|nr:MFS transporter [Haloechinothrix sp. LS1_15]